MDKKQADRIEEKVDQVIDAMIGTKYTNGKGLIDAVHQNTKFRRKGGYIAGAISGISFGAAYIWNWLS